MHDQFKYYAFISYSSKDTEWGKRVQRKLEHYRMPATLCSERGWERTPIKPVFFAPTDIQPGGLTEELQERLRASQHLIVICSPNSAQSEWVGKEIEYFHQLGHTKQIHFFIVDGQPHSGNKETECFNPIVKTLGLPEILGANIHEKNYSWPWLNKERAYVQLVSKLLGVEFDTIWQRHRRLLIQKLVGWIVGIILLAVLWGYTLYSIIPFSAELTVRDVAENNSLPPYSSGIATVYLDNELWTDTLYLQVGKCVFKRIPHKYLNKKVRVTIECKDYYGVDTILVLNRHISLDIHRNPDVYGHIRFRLWNFKLEKYVANCDVIISDDAGREYTAKSNDEGIVEMNIPLEMQRSAYMVSASVPLEENVIHMPCGENDVILTK